LAAGDSYEVGSIGGEATHTLTVDEMPSHTHIAANYTGMVGWSGSSPSRSYLNNTNDGYVGSNNPTTKATGGSAAHNNMPPYLAVYMWRRTA
jgi:microcystin-dependent protein